MNPNQARIPTDVEHLLHMSFPNQTISAITTTSGGFSNLTAHAQIGAESCVIKAATAPLKRADVQREAEVLALLRDSNLPVPPLIVLIENDTWTIAVTRYIAGIHGLQVLEQAPDQLVLIYYALGKLIADVHRTSVSSSDPDLQLDQRAQSIAQELSTLQLAAEFATPLTEALTHPIWQAEARCLVHGDLGLHNLLWNGQITALLDWEWSGLGTPLLDFAWLIWTIHWRKLSPALWDTFLAGYSTGPGRSHSCDAATFRALALGQIAGILIRVQQQAAAREEWLRRLRWTLELEFPTLELPSEI